MHYFILAVSKHKAQLYEVTGERILPRGVDGMPTSMSDAWAGAERMDSTVQSHSAGNGHAMFHGQGGAKDVTEQEENQYMHALAKSLHNLLHNQADPLVFAGVAEEYGMFKKFDQSGRLLDEYIKGSPDHLSPEECKQHADPIVKAYRLKQNEALVEEYGNLLGTGRTSTDADAILDAAERGKVDLLLIAEGHEAEAAEATTLTVAHRGRVAVVKSGSIPEGVPLAAVLRH